MDAACPPPPDSIHFDPLTAPNTTAHPPTHPPIHILTSTSPILVVLGSVDRSGVRMNAHIIPLVCEESLISSWAIRENRLKFDAYPGWIILSQNSVPIQALDLLQNHQEMDVIKWCRGDVDDRLNVNKIWKWNSFCSPYQDLSLIVSLVITVTSTVAVE